MRKPIRKLPFSLHTTTADTERAEEPVDLESLRLSEIAWKEQPSGHFEHGELRTFQARVPFTFGGEGLILEATCTVKLFRGGRTVSMYKWHVPGKHHGGLHVQLDFDKRYGDAPVVDAQTDIRRFDPEQKNDTEDARSLPNGIGREFYAKILDMMQDLSQQRSILHVVNRLPDLDTSEEQWNRAFRGMLLERGYENAEGSVQYRKLYEKSK